MLSRYFVIALIALSLLQYALLRSIRSDTDPRPQSAPLTLERETVRSLSLLVDLVSESRAGLRGSFDEVHDWDIEQDLSTQTGVVSTRIFANDPYLIRLIEHYGEIYMIDPTLIHLIIEQESNYDPFALSPAGAMGFMQLMPDTAWLLGLEDPWDPAENIEGGVRYLAHQLDRFGSLELALAAYNAGPGAVESWGGIPPYPETTQYVSTITRRYLELSAAQDEKFTEEEPELLPPPLEPFESEQYFP